MSSDAVPEATLRFLEDHILSVTQLEILLLLRRHARDWSVEEVARELRSSTDIVRRHLQHLHAKGVLKINDPCYCYDPSDVAREDTVKSLSELYQSHRSRLIDFIYTEKLPAARVFADAFKIKKDKS